MKKILLTGGASLLGLNWAAAVRDKTETILGLHTRKVNLRGALPLVIDISTPQSALRDIESLRPEMVVHLAGMTNIEQCEIHPETAFHKNITIALNVAQACKKLSIKFVYISSDHLFDGSDSFADENTAVQPRNIYGYTKAAAESHVLDTSQEALVIRTNFYGWGTSYRRSFSDSILDSLKKGVSIKLFQDVFFTPILAESLALAVMKMARLNATGIFNIVCDKRISKFDFGVRLAREFGLDATLIIPVSIFSRADLVERPLDMSLSNQKSTKALGRAPSILELDIKRLRQQEKQGLARELGEL